MYTATRRSKLGHEMVVPLANIACEPLAVGASPLRNFDIFTRILFFLLSTLLPLEFPIRRAEC